MYLCRCVRDTCTSVDVLEIHVQTCISVDVLEIHVPL